MMTFTLQQELDAIAENNRRRQKVASKYNSGNQGFGYLGEQTVDFDYPMFLKSPETFGLYDRVHPATGEVMEIKTQGGKFEWQDYFSICFDFDQWKQETGVIVIYCHYWLTPIYPRKCIVAGWGLRSEMETHPSKRFYDNGKWALNRFGVPMFQVKNPHGCFIWDGALKPMAELVSRQLVD